MLRLLGSRLVSLALTLLVVSAAIFLVLEVLPGDPAAIMLGTSAREDTLAALRTELGLDRPAWERYAVWIGGLATGDLGRSITYGTPVADLVADRLAVTVPLAALAIVLAVTVALPLGIAAAARRDRAVDRFVLVFSQLGVAVPNFWLGLLFILLFSTKLGWLPAGGFPGWSAGPGPALRALVLPAVALALPQAAVLARVTRSAALEVIGADFVRTALAKGLTEGRILRRHVVPNTLVPVATILGLQLSFLLAGAILVENVFTLPGLGRLAYQALAQRDLVVIRSVVLLLSGLVIVVNFAV
ncbi:MAG TPA: ABC transporter permease, partial [Beijerinckiaceae bacterium]|nr:ABC transporter permease [Beijerinckiaceae bacterium]